MPDSLAVVVGLCAHGLAITRSLHEAGVRVVAVEANRCLPGLNTNTAEVLIVDDINGPELIKALISLAENLSATTVPVLYLTNDTMVNTIGTYYKEIRHLYRVSWGSSRRAVLPLLRKEQIYNFTFR